MRAHRLLGLLGLLAQGCGTPSLEGSLGQMYDLGYDETRVRLAPEDLAVSFVKRRAQALGADGGALPNEDYPFVVRVALSQWVVDGGVQSGVGTLGFLVRAKTDGEPSTWADEGIPFGAEIDLTQGNGAGAQRGTYSRNISGTTVNFPRARRAEIFFDRMPQSGAPVKGRFHVTFENGIESASGRTVFDSFAVKEVQ